MSILVICGYEEPACSAAHSVLARAGLPEANAFRDGAFTARALTKKICHAYKLSGSKRKGYSQVSPGKMWQALSVDLMLANLEAESWGWADPRNVHFLDYWRDFDPRFSFVLVYSSPQQVLARLMEQGPAEPEAVEAALAEWRAYNEELLRFYNANRDRSMLVNAELIAQGPVDFLSACQERFDLDLRRINEPLELDAQVSAMALWSASTLFSGFREAATLFDELESAADLPRGAAPDPQRIAQEAWSQHRTLAQDNLSLRQAAEALEAQKRELEQALAALRDEKEKLAGDAAASAAKLRAETEEAKKENELLLLQLHQVQEELEQYFHKYRDLQEKAERGDSRAELAKAEAQKSELERTVATLRKEKQKLADDAAAAASLRAETEEAKKENDLLLLQLHQVQEELEHYFHKYRDLQEKAREPATGAAPAAAKPQAAVVAASKPAPAEPKPVVIDLRHFIDGQNWHSAEDDGRWAGPGTRSTLRLPRLDNGRYRIDVDVVDAMTPEIARNMRVSLNGSPVAMKHRSMDSLAGVLAPLKRAYLVHYKRRQLYPLRLSGVVDVDAGRDQAPLQIEFDFPDAVSPASRGEPDGRSLAARLSKVAITPC